jgi:hypothetical protein
MSTSISKYFSGIGAKRLSEVEIAPAVSNQHEFNGIADLKNIFGSEKIRFNGKFILLNDDEDKIIEANGALTWYDARENHATRTEFRLYYSSNAVIDNCSAGDLVVIGRTAKDSLAIIVASKNSTTEKQLLWLFGLSEVGNKFVIKSFLNENKDLGFAGRFIISSLGFDTDDENEDYLPLILERFGNSFPSTNIFSEFARTTITDVSPIETPDRTLLSWMDREQMLFKTLERHIVEKKLNEGFGEKGTDVEDFIQFSLSVQNRRKSRAGFAFENHLSKIFDAHKIRYTRGQVTELNKKPDMIFPGIKEYHDETFDVSLLTLLGLKTSAKDRWRQVLSEGARVKNKNLITLEPSISKNQTDEMVSENLQLVIPQGIIETYTDQQREQILTLNEFIDIIKDKQTRADIL